MNVVYHPAVQKDLNAIFRYYDRIDPRVGDAFWEEFLYYVQKASKNPTRFHSTTKNRRRANLKRFSYHFLFRQFDDRIRITVVRHHQRHPQYGINRP